MAISAVDNSQPNPGYTIIRVDPLNAFVEEFLAPNNLDIDVDYLQLVNQYRRSEQVWKRSYGLVQMDSKLEMKSLRQKMSKRHTCGQLFVFERGPVSKPEYTLEMVNSLHEVVISTVDGKTHCYDQCFPVIKRRRR